jgi:hypothetical protein
VVEPGTYPRLAWRALSETPEQEIEVLFGVAEGSEWWETRWDRGQNGCEFLYAEHLARG